MDTNALKKFAQEARRELLEQVEARLEQVLHTDSVELREKLGVVNELRDQLKKKSKENLIEEVAYTWFNRFCALRYMDVNHITKMGIVSPMPNFTQPEILQDAKQGIFDKDWRLDKSRVQGLLNGTIPSTNPEGEAYRLLLVAVCNSYAEEMDFLFPRIEDYTELLMPEDLLSTQSVLHSVREALTKEVCQDVEVIGWLYQFYISEKKDQVMGQKGKVASEDIPAVTQLFTPHWIVRYMVENSLGRLWLLNHPRSKIRNQMEFYIEPAKQEEESLLPEGEGQDEGGDGNEGEGSFLKVDSPEELKILDPACGSGHILTYAFVLLYAIYEEMGYDPISIPQLILEKNLYGIEIDKRAAMLSSFALMMKAVEKDKRFLTREVQPNILEMEDVSFEPKEVKAYMAKVGEDLWTQDLWLGLQQFENAKTFGSLIRPVLKDVPELRERLKMKGVFEELFLANTNKKVQKVLKMSEYLSPRHQVVVANPPYMGGKNLNKILKDYARDNFPDSKSDLFAMFIEHGFELIKDYGYNAMVTMQSWMFLSSFEKMRKKLLDTATIECMVHMANMVMGIAFGTAATVWINQYKPKLEGQFSYVNYEDLDNENKPTEFPVKNDRLATASATDFKKIPGAPISYWLPRRIYEIFEKSNSLDNYYNFQIGMITGNNQKYIRNWYEVNLRDIGFGFSSRSLAKASLKKWFPYAKGGGFRRWAGNRSFVINWEKDGYQLQNTLDPTGSRIWAHNFNLDMIFKPSISWNSVTSSDNSFRYFPEGFLFDSAGGICQPVSRNNLSNLLGYLNSPFADILLPIVNPTINLPPGYLGKLPYKEVNCEEITERLISLTMGDWDSYELSWNFLTDKLLRGEAFPQKSGFRDKYESIRSNWASLVNEIIRLEEKNNKIHIRAFDLNDEIELKTPLEKISLTCNPLYRYGGNYSQEELESRLLEDTIKEFISYGVGCMFGRYSLDKPGLILANQGETVADYYKAINLPPLPRAEWLQARSAKCKGSREPYKGEGGGEGLVLFPPTETNVIPILEGEWFSDDILTQFKRFLRVTFGEENFAENLRFIEDALGKDLHKYFLRDFYKDHVKTYKKRPIYWLFSSPIGSFNALIYMHRYTPETVSVVLNQYLREYRDKLTAHRTNLERISTNASARDKSQALKEIEDITRILAELKEYEDEVLYPLASQQIQIDLDDGVKVNYAKFGNALKKI